MLYFTYTYQGGFIVQISALGIKMWKSPPPPPQGVMQRKYLPFGKKGFLRHLISLKETVSSKF
jgi:hypothetical protein